MYFTFHSVSFRDSEWKRDIVSCLIHENHFIMEKNSQETEDKSRSMKKQTICAFLINSVAFLQGASVPTSTIILTKLQNHTDSQEDLGMFHDFHITEEEGSWIGKTRNIITISN